MDNGSNCGNTFRHVPHWHSNNSLWCNGRGAVTPIADKKEKDK